MIPARRKLATVIGNMQRRVNERDRLTAYETQRLLEILREIDVMLAQMEDEPVPARLRRPAKLHIVKDTP